RRPGLRARCHCCSGPRWWHSAAGSASRCTESVVDSVANTEWASMRYRSFAFSFALPCALSLAVLTTAAISPAAAQPAGRPTVVRPPPEDPELTFHGHSTGHWEGDTLVVDTVHILPQAPLAISEAAGIPNNGDMRVVERIHLADKDILHVDLEIFAPKILTKPWKTTRIFFRQRARKFDIVEGVCVQGDYSERVDANGDHVFVPVEKTIWGN